MKKQVVIAGIGMGSQELLTGQVRRDIKKAEVIIGAERMLRLAKETLAVSDGFEQGKKYIQSYHPDEIAETVKKSEEHDYCVLMSGDTGFYSGAKKLTVRLKEIDSVQICLHPGISSLSYLCAAFGKDYSEAVCASLHGRTENIAYKVRTNKLVFLVTDGSVVEIAKYLCEYGLSYVTLYVGCQLSYKDETLFSCEAGSLQKERLPENGIKDGKKPLFSLLIENSKAVSRTKPLKDGDFIRGKVPMTKEAVRNQVMAMFDVEEDAILYDIGAGTGALSMGLAQKVPEGSVYAIECNPEGVSLIEQNKRTLSMDQVHVVETEAPKGLETLPLPDAVLIGGSKGKLKEILSALRTKKKPDGKLQGLPVVINAITLETLHEVLGLEKQGLLTDLELMQFQVSRRMPLGSYHRMEPENPIWLAKAYI